MRIISVIESNTDSGILGVESFGIFEEQLSQDVVDQAEENFKSKAIENGANEDDIETDIENGFYARRDGYTVSLVWSYI
jgi:hypothetical protein